MGNDPTLIMLDQLMRVVVGEAIRALVWLVILFPVVRLLSKSND